jgi:hypothetical protein
MVDGATERIVRTRPSRTVAVLKTAQRYPGRSPLIPPRPVLPGHRLVSGISRDHGGRRVHRTDIPRAFPGGRWPAVTGAAWAYGFSLTMGVITPDRWWLLMPAVAALVTISGLAGRWSR